MLAGAGPARNRRAAERAACQSHIDFDSRVAARIENLARNYFVDVAFSHRNSSWPRMVGGRRISFNQSLRGSREPLMIKRGIYGGGHRFEVQVLVKKRVHFSGDVERLFQHAMVIDRQK